MNREEMIDNTFQFVSRLFAYSPASTWSCIRRLTHVRDARMLDVGCGEGDMARISGYMHRNWVVGCDLHQPYLEINRKKKTYSDLVRCDARYLPFRRDTFDIVICLEVIEHFESKEVGLQAIDQFERIAKRRVIISTPVGYAHQRACGGNEWQEHHTGWASEEMARLGYSVTYVGLSESVLVKFVKNVTYRLVDSAFLKHKEHGALASVWLVKLLDMSLRLPYYLLGRLTFRPGGSSNGHMICTKEIG